MMRLKKYPWLNLVVLLCLGLASCNLNKAPVPPTLDVNIVYTSVASTMIAGLNDQLTQTAEVTPSPEATATPTGPSTPATLSIPVEATLTPSGTNANLLVIPSPALTSVISSPTAAAAAASGSTAVGCADSIFLEDLTIPDGTVIKPETVFIKKWSMKNTGTCDWAGGFKFAYAYGTKLGTGALSITLTSASSVPPGGSHVFSLNLTAPSIQNTYTGCWKMQTDQGYWFGQAACVTIKVSK